MDGERILVVEDERIVLMDIKNTLKRLGYVVPDTAAEGAEAVAKAGKLRPDLVLMDVRLDGDMDGVEAARHVHRLYDIPVIFLTAYSDPETLERAKASAPFGYLLKPFEEREVHSAIELALYKHHVEQRMRQAKAAAEAANEAKTSFLGTVSHELRTPMNGVIGMTELLLMTELSEEQEEYAQLIKNSSLQLLGVLNDILDYSRIEARTLKMHHAPFDLLHVLEEAVAPWREQAEAKGLSFQTSVDPAAPVELEGDASRFKQALSNLVHNAVKFTEHGGVTVEVESFGPEPASQECTDSRVRLHVVVSDTGPGVPAHSADKLFESFTQGEDYMTRRQGGLGLGLSIASQLVELLGGRIWVESEEGRGSAFHFTALIGLQDTARDETAPSEEAWRQADLSGRRILVAEDNHTSRMLAVRLLSQRGAEVAAVEDGEQALEALAQREHDLVLMDIQMPAMDGIQATRAIRSGQAEGVRSDIPIIAVTAHAMKGDAQRCLEAGMNRYLSKPLDLKRLMAAIQCVLEQDAAGEAAAQPAANSSPTPLLEVESTLARMENDKDLHQDILQAFLDDGPSRVHEIRTAWDQGDAEGLRRANHTLRGAAVNVGALRLVEATQELSLALQEDFHAARPAMDRLFEVLEQTQARVREHMGAS